MNQYLYVVHDVKADTWAPPVTMDSLENCQQFLDMLVNTHGNGHHHLYPEDFICYCIGEYDDETGHTTIYPEKQFAVNLAGLKRECKLCQPLWERDNESE